MTTVTALGALVIIIGWITLVEFDSYDERERKKIVKKIKNSPLYVAIIILMPLGILMNVIGTYLEALGMIQLGAFLIFLQGIIVAFLFWKKKRWKSIFLFVAVIILGLFMYVRYVV